MNYFFGLLLGIGALSASTNEEVFTQIYEKNEWGTTEGGKVISGPGSALAATEDYRKFLQDFLREHHISSIVEAGSGDWYSSQYVDWEGIDYMGFDVVQKLVDLCNKQYGTSNISFYHADVVHDDLPPADLFLCKDVLQHLSNADIVQLLAQCAKYKYCLLTTEIANPPAQVNHPGFKTGSYRIINLHIHPFYSTAKLVFQYKYIFKAPATRIWKQKPKYSTKGVFLITN